MFSNPYPGIISLAEAATLAKTTPSTILNRCVQNQLTAWVVLPPGTPLFDYTPGRMRPVKSTGNGINPEYFSIQEFNAIKWDRSKADTTADLNDIEVADTEGRPFGVFAPLIIRESDLCFHKWDVVKPEYFSIQEVVAAKTLEDDVPLSVADVADLAIIRSNPRNGMSEPVLWPSFYRKSPILAQCVMHTGKRLHTLIFLAAEWK